MEQKMFNFPTRGEKHRRLCAGSSPASEPGFTPVLILSLMVACFPLDMVYIQIVMEEDQKEGTPGSLQPFLSFCILFWASALYCQTGMELVGLCGTGRALGRLEVHQQSQSPDETRDPSQAGAVGREEAGAAPGPAWPRVRWAVHYSSPEPVFG